MERKEYKIKSITLLGVNRPSRRKVKVALTNGTKITIESCHESWEQYGGNRDELCTTVPIAQRYNDWLHGGDLP